jgi:hypothetical protein
MLFPHTATYHLFPICDQPCFVLIYITESIDDPPAPHEVHFKILVRLKHPETYIYECHDYEFPTPMDAFRHIPNTSKLCIDKHLELHAPSRKRREHIHESWCNIDFRSIATLKEILPLIFSLPRAPSRHRKTLVSRSLCSHKQQTLQPSLVSRESYWV